MSQEEDQGAMTDSFGYTSPQEADSTVIPSLSRDLKALVMREIPRQARNDSKDFYRITLTQPKESVMSRRPPVKIYVAFQNTLG